jgi:hypothetical protein
LAHRWRRRAVRVQVTAGRTSHALKELSIVSTTPTDVGVHGGAPPRGLAGTPGSSIATGRFGRIFRNLPVYDVSDASLIALGEAMIQQPEDGALDKPLGDHEPAPPPPYPTS